jgi:purine-binding chemotaxis protein CheW
LAEINNDATADVTDVVPEEEVRVCLFSIGEDTYAIPVGLLTEILLSQKIFPIPTTPSYVLGVMNLRGNIVPVVDIRPALSLPPADAPGQIAIIKQGTITLGIIVDNVSEVVGIPERSVQTLPADTGAQTGKNRGRFLSGDRKSVV